MPCGSVYRSKHGTASFPWPFGRAPSPSPFVATSELRNAPSNIGRRSFRDPPQRRCSTERAPGSLAAQNDAGEEDDYEDEDVGTDEDEPASDADEDAAAPPAETVPPRGARREASSEQQTSEQGGRRVWEARPESTEGAAAFSAREQHWHKAVDDESDRRTVNESLSRICEQVRASFCRLACVRCPECLEIISQSPRCCSAGTRGGQDETEPAGGLEGRSRIRYATVDRKLYR